MRFLRRPAFLALLLGAIFSGTLAQTSQKQSTGVITGRVTYGEKAAANVGVVLLPAERTMRRGALMKVTTDYEGRYRMANVPAGRFNVLAIAPAYVGQNEGAFGEQGKAVTIAEGETVEKIDFSLVKGGVITGRVTTGDGVPVIGERVHLYQVDQRGQRSERSYSESNPFMFETDDRGIYRLYGLMPGRYTISIGDAAEEGSVRFGYGGRGYYTRTFHPGVTEEAKATVIEIAEGSEATNVDITLGGKSKSFTASGRVVDENGKPVVGARIGNGAVTKEANGIGEFGWGTLSDSNGAFRIDGLLPGRYAAFVWNEGGELDGYSDAVQFEINEGNVSGLELKLHRGASISGVAVIEGTTDRAALAKLSQLSLGASGEADGLAPPVYANVKIAPDGSFRITGLRPGKLRMYLATYPPLPGFSLARIEREGVAQREIEVTAGAQVTGVRVVIEYGTGSVRGLVKIENGPLPEGMRMYVTARRRGDTTGPQRYGAQVDSRGRFLLEGMSSGEYELTLQTFSPDVPQPRIVPNKQTVTVTNGVESETTFTLDLKARQPEGDKND